MSVLSKNSSPIIIDMGSSSTRFGFSTDLSPKIIPTVIGTPGKNHRSSSNVNETFIGQSAQKRRGILQLEYPIKKGFIENFDSIKKILQHIFDKELSIDPSDHKILIALPSKNQLEKIEEIFLDTFNVQSIDFCDQAKLSLLFSGVSTGLVVDIGEGLTQITPCYENEVIKHAATNFAISGSDITEEFKRKLNFNENSFNGNSHWNEIAKEIKDEYCCVRGYEVAAKFHILSNRQSIKIDNEISQSGEILFSNGIHEVIKDVILKCDKTIQKELFENILMVGGGANIKGLKERLENELMAYDGECKFFTDGENAAWIGGSILASRN